MASNPIGANGPVVTAHAAHVPNMASILARLDRTTVETFLSVAIDLLDVMDPDPDLELSGDETDWNNSEDEEPSGGGGRPLHWGGPGCPISDPDASIDDARCDDVDQDLEEEYPVVPAYPMDQTRDALPVNGGADQEIMRPYLERIRATRCDRIDYRPFNGRAVPSTFRLRGGGEAD